MKNKELGESPRISECKETKVKETAAKNSDAVFDLENADRLLEERIKNGKDDTVEFESPEKAKQYFDRAYKNANKYKEYTRKADKLLSDIKAKRQPESMMSEVNELKKKAEAAKREGERYSRYAKTELNRF